MAQAGLRTWPVTVHGPGFIAQCIVTEYMVVKADVPLASYLGEHYQALVDHAAKLGWHVYSVGYFGDLHAINVVNGLWYKLCNKNDGQWVGVWSNG